MVQFASVVGDAAAGDRTTPVEAAQCSALGTVGEPGGAAEVQFAGGVEHDAVADHDGVDVGVAGELGDDPGRDLDGDRPVHDRTRSWCVGVDDREELSPPRPAAGGGAVDEAGECQGPQVMLAFDRVGRCGVGHGLGEQRLHRGVELGGELDAGDGIEPAA